MTGDVLPKDNLRAAQQALDLLDPALLMHDQILAYAMANIELAKARMMGRGRA